MINVMKVNKTTSVCQINFLEENVSISNISGGGNLGYNISTQDFCFVYKLVVIDKYIMLYTLIIVINYL